jgi:hypothetical protein
MVLQYYNNIVINNTLASFLKKPFGYWTIKKMRNFMENFARNKNLDPLISNTWYNISASDIKQLKVKFKFSKSNNV